MNRLSFILLSLFLLGCNFFETRSPQDPGDSGGDFQPASTHYQLLNNFTNSFNQLNVEYYSECFINEQNNQPSFQFVPDADALARYGILFNNWSKDSERQYLQGLVSSLPDGIFPNLLWKSKKYDIITSDSAVFVGEYNILIKQKNYDENYKGILRFIFARSTNGLWYIKNWSDFRNQSDTFPSWSILKARYAL